MTTETLMAISFLMSNGHISENQVQKLQLKPYEMMRLKQIPYLHEDQLPANLETVIKDTFNKIKSGDLRSLGDSAAPTTDCVD